MQHTITAKYVAWPAARFVRPAGREWERHLGLRSGLAFERAVTHRQTRRPVGLSVIGWQPAPVRIWASGIVRPAVHIHWAGHRCVQPRRASMLASASWRG